MKKYIFFEKEGQLAYTVIDEKSTNILTDIQNKYKFIIINDKFPSYVYIDLFDAYYIDGNTLKLDINRAKSIYIKLIEKKVSMILDRLNELEYRYIMDAEKIEKINIVRSELDELNDIDLSNITNVDELLKVQPTILDIYEELLK